MILAKNQVNFNVLTFLSRKYRVASKLLGLMKALSRAYPEASPANAIAELDQMNISPEEVDQASIVEKLRLYDALG